MHAMQSYLNSFSCFVENNSKTRARVVAVCEICMSTAAIKRGSGDVDVDRLRFHAAMIDVDTSYDLALCARVTTETECERTGWMRTYSVLFAVF